MITLNISLLAPLLGMLVTIAGGIIFGYRLYHKFEELPEKVALLEKQMMSCPAHDLDVDVLREEIQTLSKKMDNDYRNIKHISNCQVIMMGGMMNMFQHFINGNHVKEMQSSYDEMMREIAKTNTERIDIE